MCMKINEVSLSRWSKTEVGGLQRPRWFYPLGRLNFPVEEPGGTSVLHCCRRGGLTTAQASRRTGKSRAGAPTNLRDVKNEGTSGDVYENKGTNDNLPDTKDDISARLPAILHKRTRSLQEPSPLLRLFEPWRVNPSIENAEGSAPDFSPAYTMLKSGELDSHFSRFMPLSIQPSSPLGFAAATPARR